jgi:hypothetical protein
VETNISELMDPNQITQTVLGALPVVALVLCVLMCGGMMWIMGRGMMSQGGQPDRPGKQNDKREPPPA